MTGAHAMPAAVSYAVEGGIATLRLEKSPNNVYFFEHLNYMFPDSPLVHVIRDGRDVVCSLLTMDWINPKNGQRLKHTTNAFPRLRTRFLLNLSLSLFVI